MTEMNNHADVIQSAPSAERSVTMTASDAMRNDVNNDQQSKSPRQVVDGLKAASDDGKSNTASAHLPTLELTADQLKADQKEADKINAQTLKDDGLSSVAASNVEMQKYMQGMSEEQKQDFSNKVGAESIFHKDFVSEVDLKASELAGELQRDQSPENVAKVSEEIRKYKKGLNSDENEDFSFDLKYDLASGSGSSGSGPISSTGRSEGSSAAPAGVSGAKPALVEDSSTAH